MTTSEIGVRGRIAQHGFHRFLLLECKVELTASDG